MHLSTPPSHFPDIFIHLAGSRSLASMRQLATSTREQSPPAVARTNTTETIRVPPKITNNDDPTPPIERPNDRPTPNNSPLAFAMSELYSDMWTDGRGGGGGGGGFGGRRVANPSGVLRALVKGNRWFAGNGQHDAHEAMRSILDLLHEELRRPVSRAV